MVLSRFWLVIFITSIAFIVVSLFTANTYTIDYVLNGHKDDPVLVSEKYLDQIPAFIRDSIELKADKTMIVNRDITNPDTT
ncbi:MAG: spore maturation protein, partial [Flavobacterium sp.]